MERLVAALLPQGSKSELKENEYWTPAGQELDSKVHRVKYLFRKMFKNNHNDAHQKQSVFTVKQRMVGLPF